MHLVTAKACSSVFFLTLLISLPALAQSPALVRDATVATVQTLQGSVPARLAPVAPAHDLTLLILADSLTAADAIRLRREIAAAFTPSFLNAHRLQIVSVSGRGGDFSTPLTTPAQLQAALKQITPGAASPAAPLALIETLGAIPANLPANWAHTVIAGHLPAFTSANTDTWVSAWLGELYRKQRVRLSFWSLDGNAPAWAQTLAGAAMGMVATTGFNTLLPMLSDNSAYTEVSWEIKFPIGAWPYTATLKNSNGDSIATVASLATAPAYTLPLQAYLSVPASDPEKVLSINPADLDALRLTAQQLTDQKKPKEAAVVWRSISEIAPTDGLGWAALAKSSYDSGSFEDAAAALAHATSLGVKNSSTLELQARLRMHDKDFQGALAPLDDALALDPAQQPLWLLRAECARSLKLRPKEAESVERAAALGDVPPFWAKDLIAGYLEAGQVDRALPYLRKVSANLPGDAPSLVEYAGYWELAHQPQEAEPLWNKALVADPKNEAAYLGLVANYTAAKRYADAGQIADRGLVLLPKSPPLLVAKEQALESLGDLYGARRFLSNVAPGSQSLDLLKRRAALEDVYGGAGPDSYLALLQALTQQNAAQVEVVATCRRALLVSLREERLDAAKTFAAKLSSAGDRGGLDLVTPRSSSSHDRVEIPGGADALQFLLLGQSNAKITPAQALLNAASVIANQNPNSNDPNAKAEWQHLGSLVHEYFQRIAALNALGRRQDHAYEILLSLQDKPGRQRTEKVFDILGLKMHRDKEGVSVKSAEGKSQARKQDVVAALAIDEQGIEDALAQGKTYTLEIPFDLAPVFPSEEFWRTNFYDKEKFPGGLVEAFVGDVRLPRLFTAFNSMDRAAAQALVHSVVPKNLAEHYSTGLWMFSTALALNGQAAEVPGGEAARSVWASLAGVDPASGVAFFEALLRRDDGRLISFFYALSQLDFEHQRFFTHSTARAQRFYELFRNSFEMRHGGDTRMAESGFTQFLREVPLNDNLTVDFPGSPEVWMVAKGLKTSGGSVAKLTRSMKKTAAPDDEDQILIRLATTEYKNTGREQTELANFIAVSRIDSQRSGPLTPESALLLAQAYSTHRGLYPYLVRLGDLETADYQKLLSLESKVEGVDAAYANLHLGQIHSFLAIAGAARESALLPAPAFLPLFRKALDRYLASHDAAAFTAASLAFVSELLPYAKDSAKSPDAVVRLLLLGEAGPLREKAFDQVLALQKIPSLDGLLSIDHNLQNLGRSSSFDEIQRDLDRLAVIPLPKEWHLTGERKKSIELYDSSQAIKVLTKLRLTAAKHKKNEEGDLQKLSAELRSELEPWVELALVGRLYARYLDGSDLLVSEDPMLVRKHEFIFLGPHNGKVEPFQPANILLSSEGEGSYFVGGLAEFSMAAGIASAGGNHIGAQSFGSALVTSVRATDWRGFNAASLSSFAASVRLAREWIVAAAADPAMRAELSDASRGILSLGRRKALLQSVEDRDWPSVWKTVSVSDLHFLGDALTEQAPPPLWRTPQLIAMKQAAQHSTEPDMLGSVAPGLSGSAQPRLERYEPYEEYQHHLLPDLLSQRLAELKINLAWAADNAAWDPSAVMRLSEPAAADFLAKLRMRDSWDWNAALDAYRALTPAYLESLFTPSEHK